MRSHWVGTCGAPRCRPARRTAVRRSRSPRTRWSPRRCAVAGSVGPRVPGRRLAAGTPRGNPRRPAAVGAEPVAARVNALAGSAAGARGRLDPDTARRLLDGAAPEPAPQAWRFPGGAHRAGPGGARAHSRRRRRAGRGRCAGARDGGSAWHERMSRIVLAVTRSAQRHSRTVAAAALGELDIAAPAAVRNGSSPLVRPAGAAQADLPDQ